MFTVINFIVSSVLTAATLAAAGASFVVAAPIVVTTGLFVGAVSAVVEYGIAA